MTFKGEAALGLALLFSLFFFSSCGSGNGLSGMGCEQDGRGYVSRDPAQCAAIKLKCDSYSKPFSNDCGCGCERVKNRPLASYTACNSRQKSANLCIQIYQPVCGWNRRPSECYSSGCRQSYANSCFACVDERVVGYTSGACPN